MEKNILKTWIKKEYRKIQSFYYGKLASLILKKRTESS